MKYLIRIQHAWDVLNRQDIVPGRIRAWTEDVRTAVGPVALALDDRDQRLLLAPVSADRPLIEDRRSNVVLERRILREGGRDLHFLQVACRARHLNDLFTVLAAEMLEALESQPHDANDVCLHVLHRWRELLARQGDEGLSDAEITGLYGELCFLRELLRRFPNALEVWRGPRQQPHDFAQGAQAVEVKTTRHPFDLRFTIHGLHQLVHPVSGNLALAAYRVRTDVQGESLVDVVADLHALGADPATLALLLAAAGVSDTELDRLRETRLTVVERHLFEVDETFPRIVPTLFTTGLVPNEVSDVTYRIDLARRTPLDDSAIAGIFDALCGRNIP